MTRTTHTNLDVKQEKRIDDCWNIHGSRGIYFIDPEDEEFKETIKKARKKLETSVALAVGVMDPTKFKQNLRVFWKLMNPEECVWDSIRQHHEDHITGKGENSLQHNNLVHKFIPMPQAVKIPAAKGSGGQGMGKIGEIFDVELGESQKQEEGDR